MNFAGRVYVYPGNLNTIYLNLNLFWQNVTPITFYPLAMN